MRRDVFRLLTCAAFLLTVAGCKDEPTPHAVKVKDDPRVKRIDMKDSTSLQK